MTTIPIKKKTRTFQTIIDDDGKEKHEEKSKPGMFRCTKCNYIMELPKDPITEFANHRSISYVCPRCGFEETLTGHHRLTRRCFDCDKIAEGRFWLDFNGPIFVCMCPDGHHHYVYRNAFGPLADDYDLSDPVLSSLDNWIRVRADKTQTAQLKPVLAGSNLLKAIIDELKKHDEGVSITDLSKCLNCPESDVLGSMKKLYAAGTVFKPMSAEPVYKIAGASL